MRTTPLATAALVLLLSAAPASATMINVELDPGNPYDDIPQINVDDVPIVLIDAAGHRTTLRTVGGAVDFGDVADGHYTLTFPENPEYKTVEFSVPVIDPQTGKELPGVRVYPKHESGSGDGNGEGDGNNGSGGSGNNGDAPSTPIIPPWAEPTYPGQPSTTAPGTPSSPAQPPASSQAQAPGPQPDSPRWPGFLASTGANVWWLIAGAVLAILAGLGLLGGGRRRESHNTQEDSMQTGDEQ
ncbi:LPXTG cell wall anchor domain-containing protein [Corynebacterium sp.]|uniref:LPXTG cell wall anchor domain-containing protein n=1 Tax=Corynebacterium sp. TaxID=1720 RepID=UPI0026DAE3B7|nr:LPXTG cell wall anchor domain-containing protein [Corynebacterium sp.]MDO5032343.1 LPXTG cell wall anchor domain-containing protein [Corynebacterium sp.]